MLLLGKEVQKVLSSHQKCDMIMPTSGGYLVCPRCRRNKHLLKLSPETEARGLIVYCRDCKTEFKINISQGQCFESRSQ